MIAVLPFLINIIAYILLISYNIFDLKHFQIASIISEVFTLLLFTIVYPLKKTADLKPLRFKKAHAIVIVLLNAILTVASIWYLYSIIDFASISEKTKTDVKSMALLYNSFFVFLSQTGGWFIQTFLTYMLAVFTGIDIPFTIAAKAIGVAYTGFLLFTLIILLYNIFFLKEFSSFEQFNTYISLSKIHIILGKMGEFMTLSILAFFFIQYDNKNLSRPMYIAYLPNIFLMTSVECFKYIIL